MKKKGITHKLLSLLLVFTLVLSFCAFDVQSAFADDEPAPIEDTYEIDGVTYFKVNSDAFATSPTQYQLDMLRTKTSSFKFPNDYGSYFQYYWPCVGDFWLFMGAGLFREYDPAYAEYFARATALEKAITGVQVNETISGKTVKASRVLRSIDLDDYEGAIQNFYSPEGAEREVYSQIFGNASLQSDKGYFKGDSDSKTVLAGAAYAETVGENKSKVGLAVYFSDFKVISLLPEYKDNNYIQKKTKTVTESDDIIASNVKNLTGTRITASQSISRSQTDTASSTVNGSQSHSHSKSLEVGFEQSFSSIGFKFHGKVGLSATDVVSSGWSKSESQSVTESTNQSVSVNLEPYTNIMLKQQSTTEEWLTVYNCPVALQYTATIVLYDHDGSVLRSCEFGPDAREDLYNRAVRDKNLNDKDGIRWNFFDSRPITLTAIEKASSIVPMSSTGGSFTETVDTMESEVYGLLPIHPLYKVKVRAPNVSYISDETYSYGSYNYLYTDMYIGDFSYTNYMALDGLNKLNVEYYGFSKDFGHWVVADKEGNEWTGDDAPVVIEKDPVSKNTMYKAVRPGECYIKYVIDEDVYTTADHPDEYTTNSDLYQTAAVRINVKEKPFNGSISVGGSFKGKLNDEPRQLDAEGKLTVDICDETGKEVVKPYVWEAKELASKGINVDGNMVTFTKAGTFHVRAVSGDLRSDWVEIKVTDPDAVTSSVKVGDKFSKKYGTVQVTSVKNKTVAFIKAKNLKSVVVPATVTIKGKTYKVTRINAKAFTGKSIRTVTIGKNVKTIRRNAFAKSKATKMIIKTKLLKRLNVKGCLRDSKMKTAQVKVSSSKSVNNKYVKNYKRIFTKANAGKKISIK